MKDNGFSGFMVWTLALDDFSGSFCSEGKYPLLTAMNNALNAQGGSGPTTPPGPVTRPPSGWVGCTRVINHSWIQTMATKIIRKIWVMLNLWQCLYTQYVWNGVALNFQNHHYTKSPFRWNNTWTQQQTFNCASCWVKF